MRIEHSDIMVCVTRQKTCDRLISRGAELKSELNAQLHVVHCVQLGHNFLGNPDEGEALEYLFTAAQLAGGELSMLRAQNVEDALVEYAMNNSVGTIVMGAAPGPGDNIVSRLQKRLLDIEFDVLD